MSVRESIIELRNEILKRLKDDPEGFTRDLNVLPIQYGEARHQGLEQDRPESDAWDSYIYVNNTDHDVLIILQYLSGRQDGLQRIILQGENGEHYSFSLNLCIYDLGEPPRVVRRAVLYTNLLNRLNGQIPQGIRRPSRYWLGDDQVGHIVDLPIPRGQNADWTPENDHEAFIAAVTAGVNTLLPIVRCYVKNRDALFMPLPRPR